MDPTPDAAPIRAFPTDGLHTETYPTTNTAPKPGYGAGYMVVLVLAAVALLAFAAFAFVVDTAIFTGR
jgi:hypothetical protein